ncbi:MAG: CHASE2 domain-containing protein [Brasilonema angustatum HA4187-MV1]|jgi:CHASE2 domain-containing sensor protein|nr:CHASE2 domain-containing protein [Brasilonema angustatum HA4187-MV1]
MSKLVILNLGRGTLQDGFDFVTVVLQSEDNSKTSQFQGSLPAAPNILDLYRRWQLLYDLIHSARFLNIGLRQQELIDEDIKIDESDITHVSDAEFDEICQQLRISLNNWLDYQDFRQIELQLRTRLSKSDEIRFIIQTEDSYLRKLPWHIWRFFEDYRLAEVALSPIEFESENQVVNSALPVRILAILGDSTGIDIDADKKLLENLSKDAETVFLVEPKRSEIDEQLWDKQGWDILFFAGHSSSQADGETGFIHINPTESLAIEQLKNALKKAIERGLQLAIFNSCDGLGLAQQLDDLHIPQMIVMREPVPDKVAQEFLKRFLKRFADGKSFYLAVREAREQLQGLESEFPGASWLPVICQNPALASPNWKELREKTKGDAPKEPFQGGDLRVSQGETPRANGAALSAKHTLRISPVDRLRQGKASGQEIRYRPESASPKQHRQPLLLPLRQPKLNFKTVLMISFIVTSLLMGVRWLGILQAWELQAFDHFMRSRPQEKQDSRLLIVTITEDDLKLPEQKDRRGSLSDLALTRLLEKLAPLQPRAIGLDIYRDEPSQPKQTSLATRLKTDNSFFAICKVSDKTENRPGNPPPKGVPPERQGFSDVVKDPDGVLRRHLLAMQPADPTSPCTARYALNTQLAFHYLEKEGIYPKYTKAGELQLGNIVFKQLQAHMGGYQQVNTEGYQILLNYRSYQDSPLEIAPTVTLTDVLKNKVNPKQVKDRIVLIGTTAQSFRDYIPTPYITGQGFYQEIPGVILQAQMVSQIVSAVKDERPLLLILPLWGEVLWVWGWSFVGGIIAWRDRSGRHLILAGGGAIGILYFLCLILFCSSIWVPLVPSALVLIATGSIVVIYLNSPQT